jgi:CRISP-associated protein Cas1
MRTEHVIVIENPCRLSIDTARLKIVRDGAVNYVAAVDMAVLIIDTAQVEMTAGVVRQLSQMDVSLIFTDEKHFPVACLIPVGVHTHTVARQSSQLLLAQTLKDKFWSATIFAKLKNQALFLSALDKTQPLARLNRLAETIQPGDPENYEAQGAKLYWKEIFSDGNFKREKQKAVDARNSALNFGYAILRGLIVRYVCAAGLSPLFGYGHTNQENPYCLADDLIEPYRSCVDALVLTAISPTEEFNSMAKKRMLGLLECEALFSQDSKQIRYRMHAAIQRTVNSYLIAMEEKNESKLDFPRGFVLPLDRG